MVTMSLRLSVAAALQEKTKKRLRRRREGAIQDSTNLVAPEILLEKEEVGVEKKRLRISTSRERTMQDTVTWVARHIPLDLLIEILTRLPAKSVMRFKCISKFWSSLFSSRYFCNRFLMVPSQPQPLPRLYMSLLDSSNYSKSLLLSSAPSTFPSTLEFDQDLTIREIGGFYLRILRGFICFTTVNKMARVYNPSTRQLVILPDIESEIIAEEDRYSILHFIAHDPVNDQYKILCTITVMSSEGMETIKSERWVFVLEAGGSWKRVAKEFHPNHLPSDQELNMNGVLYYLAWTDLLTCVLVSFDVKSEVFSMIQVPRNAGDILPRCKKGLAPIEYGGKVAVFDFTFFQKSGTMYLWVLEDAKKKDWSRKTLVLQPCQKHLVIRNFFIPKGTTREGKVIFIPQKLIPPFYFLYYDLKNNDLKKVDIKGVPARWLSKRARNKYYFDMEFMDPSESVMYLDEAIG